MWWLVGLTPVELIHLCAFRERLCHL
uniref:Kiss-of-death n=1 Tax=Arabidopsis thaliana TaxID=3702 RepID=F2YQ10_ARATH|nr:kiss-of-death [Arabidopsis thaliana]